MNNIETIKEIERILKDKFSQTNNIYAYSNNYYLNENNKITKLSLYQCTEDEINEVLKLIVKLKDLENLYLNDNQIKDISFLEQIPQLKTLDLSNNIINDYNSLSYLPKLSSLNLNSNNLTNVNFIKKFNNTSSLRNLSLDSNRIDDFTPIENLLNLYSLSLRNNKIKDISFLKYFNKITNLKTLILDSNKIIDLTPLNYLEKLCVLNLRSNSELQDLAPLMYMKNLIDIKFTDSPIEDLTPLSNLNNLTVLWLENIATSDITPLVKLINLSNLIVYNSAVEDISVVKNFKDLVYLQLIGNRIEDIASIKDLSELTYLGLKNNNIENITDLKNLGRLRSLTLDNNKIKDITILKELISLQDLDLSNNYIFDIEPLKGLKALKNLNLQYNLLVELPSWIMDFNLNLVWSHFSKECINIYNNPLKNPPPEIIKKGNSVINIWFKEKIVYVNEVKVLLVGHGEVGKTTLVKQLIGEKPDPSEPATHYIRINNYLIEHNKKSIKLNFWDFGGQEVMHSTHQFFLSNRSIYLLVLDGRRDEDAEYWLKHIESFGGNSPVIVVLNKIDTNPTYDVDRNFLLKKYPFIVGFFKTVCLGNITGIEQLRMGLMNAIENVEILTAPWPENWIPVKKHLEDMTSDFISHEKYDGICERNGIQEYVLKEMLAGYLNDLGVVVHFKDMRLSDLHILQPRWASRAAYKIINSSKVALNHGLLKCEWLPEIMKKEDENDFEYPPQVFPYILDLMQKFELCFLINDVQEYLIPELMDIQQPTLPKHKGPILRFYLNYEDLLPRSVITRFIVRMHEDIKDNLRWRTGVVLSIPIFKSLAIIIADIKERRINISVSGPRRIEHFAIIRKTFHSLNKDFEKLKVSEWIPLPDQESFAVEYAELIGYEEEEIDDMFVGKLKRNYKVKDLLNGIELENTRNDLFVWDVFICHSSLDKELIGNIIKDLKSQKITYWFDDEQIEPGDNLMDKITDGLLRSKYILPCISENQLNSGWSRNEYQSILQRVITGTTKQKVIPFILDNTINQNIPLLLSNYNYVRYKDEKDYKKFIDFVRNKKGK